MKNINKLIICRPFQPNEITNNLNLSFCFVDHTFTESVIPLLEFYDDIYFEQSLEIKELKEKYKPIPDFVVSSESITTPKVLATPCNDTHTKMLNTIFKDYEKVEYAIPRIEDRDEGALKAASSHNISAIIYKYNQTESKEIDRFSPDALICGNDWCTEHRTLAKLLPQKLYFSVQEGPQDWDALINGTSQNKYRNTDIFLSQGPVTLKYIKPRYFSITGIPKTDNLKFNNLPKVPKVFINLNFTYGNWEKDRDQWLEQCIDCCKELNLDYLISQHPRDNGVVKDPNLVNSSAYTVEEQLISCSISISRFSLIPLETLRVGRHSIYFNPHKETPKSFIEDKSNGIIRANTKKELFKALQQHKESYQFNKQHALESLNYHAGLQDSKSSTRIINVITQVHNNRVDLDQLNSIAKEVNFE